MTKVQITTEVTIDLDDIMDSVDCSTLVEYFDTSTFLDVIGHGEVLDHFTPSDAVDHYGAKDLLAEMSEDIIHANISMDDFMANKGIDKALDYIGAHKAVSHFPIDEAIGCLDPQEVLANVYTTEIKKFLGKHPELAISCLNNQTNQEFLALLKTLSFLKANLIYDNAHLIAQPPVERVPAPDHKEWIKSHMEEAAEIIATGNALERSVACQTILGPQFEIIITCTQGVTDAAITFSDK